MLVHTSGIGKVLTDSSFKLDLNLPRLYLDNSNYTITVRNLMMKIFPDLHNTTPEQFLSLQTTAVDKSSVNPKQEILSFRTDTIGQGYDIIYHEPQHLREYKIQLPLHSSDFILTSSASHADFEIDKIEILFEIKKYARI